MDTIGHSSEGILRHLNTKSSNKRPRRGGGKMEKLVTKKSKLLIDEMAEINPNMVVARS